MIEKDNIQELFSKAFENHSAPVKPELWAGVQAKMSAAGVATGGAATVKGLSALTKWIIGSAAMATVGVTAVVVMNSGEESAAAIQTVQNNVPVVEQTVQQNTETPATVQKGAPTNIAKPEQNNKTRYFEIPALDYFGSGGHEFEDNLYLPSDNKGTQTSGTPVETPTENPSLGSNTPISGNETTGGNGQDENTGPSVQKDPVYEKAKLEFPNVFTPNGQGGNDTYHLITKENVQSVEVTIINSDNKEVFVSDDINFEWNGNMYGTGEAVSEGTYACIVIYTDLSGKKDKVYKLFQLMR